MSPVPRGVRIRTRGASWTLLAIPSGAVGAVVSGPAAGS
jgi:hypothetical protein